jgi:hypothetical protein
MDRDTNAEEQADRESRDRLGARSHNSQVKVTGRGREHRTQEIIEASRAAKRKAATPKEKEN